MPRGNNNGGAVKTILNTLAVLKVKWGKDEVTKEEVGAMAKIKGASTLRNAFAKLKKNGWITVDGGMVQITDQGMLNADQDAINNIKIPTSNEEHHDSIRAEFKKPNQVRLFNLLTNGLVHDKEVLREKMKMAKNSTWRNLVASLTKDELIAENVGKGSIRLVKKMFPVVPRPGGD